MAYSSSINFLHYSLSLRRASGDSKVTSFTMVTVGLIARVLFAAELLLGGQARITSRLTPSITKRAMAKAHGYREYLPIMPSRNAHEHSRAIGALMLAAGIGMLWPRAGPARILATSLGTALALMGIYSQRLMGIPYWLPCINTTLGLIVLISELVR